MRTSISRLAATVFAVVAVAPVSKSYAADPAQDALVQAPTAPLPERGSLAGAFAHRSFGAAELAQGAFSLPSALAAPETRGPLLARVFPAYSPGAGLSEWGQGWSTELSIHRTRPLGDLDYATDELTSPWGPLRPGDDGAYYPAGLRAAVRLVPTTGGYLATTSDGTQYTFTAAAGITTPRGVYSWNLTQVRSLAGAVTTLTWTPGAGTNRPVLTRVAYGGPGLGEAVEILYAYEALAQPFDDYRSGVRVRLDRRVKTVTVRERAGGTGGFTTRWTFTLGYQTSTTGPAFYLASIDKQLADGTHAPLSRYDYDGGSAALDGATFDNVPGLSTFLAGAGDSAVQPDHAAVSDLDDDGRPDFEHASRQTWVVHTDQGWQIQLLPAPTSGTVDTRCRRTYSTSNPPRSLARLTADTAEPQVVYTQRQGLAGTSTVLVCDRLGVPQREDSFSGDFQLGPNTRLADLDRDQRPDLVHVYRDRLELLHNESAAGAPRFVAHASLPVQLGFEPTASWIEDMNGDGIVDVVARTSGSFAVLWGTGQLGFDRTPTAFSFVRADGTVLGTPGAFKVSWLDANKDGLVDALLSQGTQMFLFTNRGGGRLVEVAVPGLRGLPWGVGMPLAVDVSGRGESEVLVVWSGMAHALDLTRPSTGLLVGADDGMGTRLGFAYARGPALPGGGPRAVVLAELRVDSTGLGAVATQYDYEAPVRDTRNRTLVGYTVVRRVGPQLVDEVTMHHDDDIAGVVLDESTADSRTPDVFRSSRHSFEERRFHAVRYLRERASDRGWRRSDGSAELVQHVENLAFERERCPTRVLTSDGAGDLLAETVLASVSAIPDDLHCLASLSQLSGHHADAGRDFVESVGIGRDAQGAVTQVTLFGDGGARRLEDVVYDARHRTSRVSHPGRGATVASYSDATNALLHLLGPDGVTTDVDELDPLTDAVRRLHESHGSATLTTSLRYDALERLERRWDDLGDASEADPDAWFGYAYASATRPASLRTRTRLGAGRVAETVELETAAGDPIATARRRGALWDVGEATERDPEAGETTTRWRGTLDVDPAGLDLAALLGGAPALAFTRAAGFGHAVSSWQTVESGVVASQTNSLALEGGVLVATTIDAEQRATRSASDAAGRTVWREDALGRRTSFGYDALGRLVAVTLPSGARHRAFYDSYGQLVRVERDGVGALASSYDPTSGLLAEKRTLATTGAEERRIAYAYDGAGRLVRTTATRAGTAAARQIDYGYDGAGLAASVAAGEKGYLTHVQGDGFDKTFVHDRAGRLATAVVTLPGWRSVQVDHRYDETGAARGDTWIVRDGAGAELRRVAFDQVTDADGRIVALAIDGREVAWLDYGADGQLAGVRVGERDGVDLGRDATTHGLRSLASRAQGTQAQVTWRRDRRSLIVGESVDAAGSVSERGYSYDPRGFLSAWNDDADGRGSYGYDVDGRIQGGAAVAFDALGRVVQRGDLSLVYGASGQVESARRGAHEWRFVYDENDQRLLKVRDGVPVAAYIGDAFLDAAHLVIPVEVGGLRIGVVEDGVLRIVNVDARGTIVAEDGEARLAGPYGERSVHPALAAALDYVGKGYDADLGLVRMGVRDFDPALGAFTTPDPLFLEEPERCVDSPSECNLYGYARGNPLSFTDPTGTEAKDPWKMPKKAGYTVFSAGGSLGKGKADILGGELTMKALGAGVSGDFSLGDHPGVSISADVYAFKTALSPVTLVGDPVKHIDVSAKASMASASASASLSLDKGVEAKVGAAVVKGSVTGSACGGFLCADLTLSAGLMVGAEFKAGPAGAKLSLDAGLVGLSIGISTNDAVGKMWAAEAEGRAYWNPSFPSLPGSGVLKDPFQLQLDWAPPSFDSTPDYTGPTP